jgi:hypothetical protein
MSRNGSRWPELNAALLRVRTMPRRSPQPSDDVTVYLVLNDHGQFGIAFDETTPPRPIAKRSSAIS